MASLLTLLNRAVSYFTKPNNEMNNSDRENEKYQLMMRLYHMIILPSIYALLANGLFLLKFIILNAKM
jgi:hypothetical protein